MRMILMVPAMLSCVAAQAAQPSCTEVARAALAASLQRALPETVFTLTADAPAAGLPPGADCRVRSVDSDLRRRMGVTLEQPDAGGSRRWRQAFQVQAERSAWRLTAPADPASPLQAAQLERVQVDAIGEADALPAGVGFDAAAWRPRRLLAAGSVLRAGDVGPAAGVRRGDVVDVVYRSGALQLQGRGTALADARPGELLRVSPAGCATDAVLGRLAADRLVEVQP